MERCCFRPRRFPLIILPFSLIFLFFVGKGYCRSGQRTKDFSCASSLPPGHELCAQGLCFDLFRTDTEQIVSGCADSSDLCAASGCSFLADRQAFVCCCAHSFCNAKSSALVRARWRMFQKGDYPLGVEGGRWRKSARNLANERGQGEKRREQSLNSTTEILIMTTTNEPKTTNWSSTFRKTDGDGGGMKEESAEGKTKAMLRAGEEKKNVGSKWEGERVGLRMDVAKTREREEHEKEEEKRTNEEEKKRKEEEEKRTNEEEKKRKEEEEKRTNEEEKKRKEEEEKRTNEEEKKRKEEEEKRTNEEEKKRKEKEEKRTNEEKRINEDSKTLTKMQSPQSLTINKSSSSPTATSLSPLTSLPDTMSSLFAPKAANNGQGQSIGAIRSRVTTTPTTRTKVPSKNIVSTSTTRTKVPSKNIVLTSTTPSSSSRTTQSFSTSSQSLYSSTFSSSSPSSSSTTSSSLFPTSLSFSTPSTPTTESVEVKRKQMDLLKETGRPFAISSTTSSSRRHSQHQQQTPSLLSPFTVSSSTNRSDRTTRSPEAVEESPTDERQRKAQRTAEDAVAAFPWYWVALAGFVCSSAVFSLVYLTLRGCRRIFNKRRSNGRESIGEAAATNGEVPIMMANGGKTEGGNRKRRVTKEGKRGAKGGLAAKGKTTTNDSLMSHCTTSTAVTTSTNEKNGSSGFEGGEQMTVLDPLLNQEWSGTLCK